MNVLQQSGSVQRGGFPASARNVKRDAHGVSPLPQLRRTGWCQAQRGVDWDTDRQRAPIAPPVRVPPPPPMRMPPPPPPPPPPGGESVLGPFGRRSALLAIMFGGAALTSALVRREDPPIYTTESGLTVAKTAGGNPVAAFSDEAGNIFLIDPNGNLYYDTGDPKLGVYFVDSKGTMLNIFIDGDGNPQYVPVGNITDLRSVDVSSIGGVPIADLEKKGVPVKDLEKQFYKQKGTARRLFAFPSEDGVALPDNAPATIAKDGTVQPPPVLEEGALLLQEKKRWWPFGGSEDGGGKFKRGG